MKNKNLTLDFIEKMGEDYQLNMIIERCLSLSLSIQKLKNVNRKEDYLSYIEIYNDICERIADMRMVMEQTEFLFNINEINTHYDNKIRELQKFLLEN